jgi:hypothetical protein
VQIGNDSSTSYIDAYVLISRNNLPLSNGYIVELINWQLVDPTATAIDSIALPTDPPVLADWQSIFGLTITGCYDDPYAVEGCSYDPFFIRAHVASIDFSDGDDDGEYRTA